MKFATLAKILRYAQDDIDLNLMTLYMQGGSFFLLLFDCFERAGSCTRAAVHTLVSIDYVLVVAFGDDAEGASISAGTALCASIRDEICHDSSLLSLMISSFYHSFSKMQLVKDRKLQKFCRYRKIFPW